MDYQQPSQEDCLVLLQEAMKAMDEFVREDTAITLEYKPPSTRMRDAADAYDRKVAALEVWNKTKQVCWPKKP